MENKQSDRELRLSRKLDAPVDLVWEVCTQPEHVAQWWGPDGFTNTIQTMEVKPGGTWNMVMHGPDGTDFPAKQVFREVVPGRKLVFENVSEPRFLTTIEFEARGDQTVITWHIVFETVEEFIQVVKTYKADEGMKQNVERLALYAAGRRTVSSH